MPNETRQGRQAEEWVASEYGLEFPETTNPESLFFDVVDPRTSAKYQVKSARVRHANGEKGRFRVWEDDHRSLTQSAAQGDSTAWYVFVLYDKSGTVRNHRRMRPSTVTKIIARRWGNAGHRLKDARQCKIPIGDIFPSR